MSYASIDDVKLALWVEDVDTLTENRITFFLDATTSIINNIVWDLTLSNKTEDIKYCDIHDNSFTLSNANVTQIKEIESKTYTWVLNTDYKIVLWTKIIIFDLNNYLTSNNFEYFSITYESWYDPVPKDIVLLQSLMVVWELSKVDGQKVSNHKVGDVTISFDNTQNDMGQSLLKWILSNYKIF